MLVLYWVRLKNILFVHLFYKRKFLENTICGVACMENENISINYVKAVCADVKFFQSLYKPSMLA